MGNVNAACVRNLFWRTPDASPGRKAAAAEVNGRKVVLRLKMCPSAKLPSFGAVEKLHFKDISNQKPGSKVTSQLFSVHHIQLLVTKDRLGSFFIKA